MADASGASSAGGGRARRAGRLLANGVLILALLGGLGLWAWTGLYQVQPGEAAVILRLGRYVATESEPGLKWHLPTPLETHLLVPVAAVERIEFGYRVTEKEQPTPEDLLEAAMQTRDNNIVHVGFVVQYRIKDAFSSRYRVADPQAILRDAAQAAVREVVGRSTIDDVLSEGRGEVEVEAETILQQVLDRYESGLAVVAVQLQEVQPPAEVRDAFDDVIAAVQDRSRAVNEAQGYANEVLPKARARAVELVEGARGYREALVARATGEAERFRKLAAEYQRAPELVRTRLYLETMEEILPKVEKVVIDPEASVLPHFPLPLAGGRAGEGAR